MLDIVETRQLITKLHITETGKPGKRGRYWYTIEAKLARRLLTAYCRAYAPECEKFLDLAYYEAEGYDELKEMAEAAGG